MGTSQKDKKELKESFLGITAVILGIIIVVGLWHVLKFFFSIPLKVFIIAIVIIVLVEENIRLREKIKKIKGGK